jgi:hypothetical protein
MDPLPSWLREHEKGNHPAKIQRALGARRLGRVSHNRFMPGDPAARIPSWKIYFTHCRGVQ